MLSFDEFRDAWSLRADEVRTFEQARNALADHLHLTLDLSDPAEHAAGLTRLETLRSILASFRDGDLPIRVRYRRPGVFGELLLGEGWRVEPSDALLKRLRQLLGTEAVRVVYERSPLPVMRGEGQPAPRLAAVG
jgi:DNA polymerase-3 subunit alpha